MSVYRRLVVAIHLSCGNLSGWSEEEDFGYNTRIAIEAGDSHFEPPILNIMQPGQRKPIFTKE
jgi:hypothetical protein